MEPASLCLGIAALLVLRAAGAAAPPAAPGGKRSANILAGVTTPLRLRQPPVGEGATCSANDTLSAATHDGWALPFGSTAQVSAHISVAQCSSAGALASLGALDLYLDCTPAGSALTLSSAGLGSLRYALPGASAAGFNATLTQDTAGGAFSLCLDGRQASPVNGSAQGGGALPAALASNVSLLAGAVALGPRGDATAAAEADVAALWLTNFVLPCGSGGDPGAMAAAAAAANRPPVVGAPAQTPAGDVFVGQQVQLSALASDPDGDPLLIRATAYGAPVPACIAAECPDVAAAAYDATGHASVTIAVAFPKPGRYVIRVEASDGGGAVVAWDHALLVRKVGDVNGSAPCCRLAPGAVAQQLGRPLHDTVFRDESVYRHAVTLGWSREYMDVRGSDAGVAGADWRIPPPASCASCPCHARLLLAPFPSRLAQ